MTKQESHAVTDTQEKPGAKEKSVDKENCDVLVIGAGPSGLSLACALSDSGLSVIVIDQQPIEAIANPTVDGRDIALTHQSRNSLEMMDVWQYIPEDNIYPLKEATVQDGNSDYALIFESHQKADQPLGHLIPNHIIRRALFRQTENLGNITIAAESELVSLTSDDQNATAILKNGKTIQAKIAVAADNRFSTARRMMGIGAKMTDYGRVMIVCNMSHKLDHQHRAQECFRYGRTCAILPLGQHFSSIVITVPAARAGELTELESEAFNREVEGMLDMRLGKMELISERTQYPLVGVYANQFVGKRFALVGDAAVGMHPVTAHGYNLALSSVSNLARSINKAIRSSRDIGSPSVLREYAVRHHIQARPLYDATNLVVSLFTNDKPLARLTRKAALRFSNNLKPFKSLVSGRLTQT